MIKLYLNYFKATWFVLSVSIRTRVCRVMLKTKLSNNKTFKISHFK